MKKRDLKFEGAVGQKLRVLRNALGWSQKHLADLADVEANQVGRIERCENSPNLAILVSLAKALGVQPLELFRIEYQVKVNPNPEPVVKDIVKTTQHVSDLLRTTFLDVPRSVKDVVEHCSEKQHVQLRSSAASAVLSKLVDEKLLRKMPAKVKGRFVYQRRR